MDVVLNPVMVILGGVILYFGAEWLVEGAAGMARRFGVKEIVIGLTVVAYGTSAPELAVSISANLSGTTPLLFGNVIGSCIANMGLILGVTALISPPLVEAGLMRRELPILLGSAIVLPIMLYAGGVSRLEAGFLLAGAIVYTYLTFQSARSTINMYETGEVHALGEEEEEEKDSSRLFFLTVVGLALLVGGGELFVRGAVGVALDLGMSQRVVGLTIVAFGTSVPELAASLVAATKGHAGLAIGNVIGSNIFNVFLVIGASGSIQALPGELNSQVMDFGFMVGLTLFGIFIMRKERTIGRIQGVLLVSVYVAFIAVTVFKS